MKKGLLFLFSAFLSFSSISQEDCFVRLQKAFDERGANPVSNDIHRHVIIVFFENGESVCYDGKARVVNGTIESIFLQYGENDFRLMEDKFFNEKKQPPVIVNGISEMIYTSKSEKLRIVFIDNLKPKQKKPQSATIPDDL